ncbi:MAG TPA: spore cortex biosynthesis protein YabQ [Bacillales bacterium]|nr:spore cortex biosynthesis protein YabQ [Bacillales bacterium]
MNLSVQFMTMAAMTVMGLWIGISVDTYGRFFYRGGRRRWNAVQIAGDLLFWLMQGLLVFLVLLNINEGDVRIYIFLALLCGYAAYKGLFQSLYRRLLEGIIQSVLYLLQTFRKFIVFCFIRPIQLFWQVVYTVGKMILQGVLALLLFVWTIVWVPLRWLFQLVLPDAFFEWVKKILRKVAGIFEGVKKIKDKLKSLFAGKD